jgi:hypothetical protein
MRETLKHRDAFEVYYKMKKRSCSKVAEKLGVKPETVENWSTKFHWQDRIDERDKLIADKVTTINIEKDIDIRAKLYNAIGLAVDKYTDALISGKATIEEVKDIDTLGRLWKDLELMGSKGEADSSQVETVTELADDEEPNEQLKPSE